MGGVEAGETEQGLGGSRCPDAGRGRAAGVDAFVEDLGARLRAGEYRPARSCAGTFRRRTEEAAARHPDGPGPCGADGGEAGAGADFRGGLPSVLVRLSAQAEGDEALETMRKRGARRRQSRARRRHSRLLRQHRPRQADDARGSARLGPAGAQAAEAVAPGGGDGRRPRDARRSRGRRKAA